MPRVTINQTNFTAGEVSPKCYGRVDLTRYQNGAEAMPNCLVDIHGGAQRRAGTRIIAAAKYPDRFHRLIPYIFSIEQAYVLEFGHLYMRVYLQGGGQIVSGASPYEIVTPYTEAMLREMDFTQGADTMFLFHQSVPIHTLQRVAPDMWALREAPIVVAPFDEIGQTVPFALTLSDPSIGTGRTASVGGTNFAFYTSDVGRRISFQSGLAVITGFTSNSTVTVRVQSTFPSATIAAGAWALMDSPQALLTPSAKDPVGENIELTTASEVPGPPEEPPVVIGIDVWRPGDVGKFVRINGGLVLITQVLDSYSAIGIIKEELSAVVAAPANAWTLESSVWGGANGYPRTGALYEQRLAVAGSPGYPQTVWGSRSGLFYDFTIGTEADQAFSFSLPSTGQINPILRMASAKALMPLTYGGEYTMEGGNDEPLTPTSVKARSPSVYGCNFVKPVRIGSEVLFVQRAGRKVRALAYRIESDTYNAPDLTVLAEHITYSGLVDMAFQQEPSSRLWCVRADGKLAVLTLDRDEGVTAWTPQETRGQFESVASIPSPAGDEVWASVKRVVQGQVRRFVERFAPGINTDCAITGTSSDGSSVWSGLSHLEGESVAVVADGTYQGLLTVTGGAVTLTRNAFSVEIGLPYASSVTLLRPEIQAGEGSSQGNPQRIHEVSLLVAETIGAKINGDEIAFREFGSHLLDYAPGEYSGFKRAGLTGWSRGDETITITQDEPYPFTLLSVIRKITVNS